MAGGYLHQPGLTADRFIADRFGPVPGARLYRSGDLGRWRPDGTIEYAGRADLMVKIRGFRIELGEIEAALAASPAVRDCIAAVRRDDTGRDVLAGYVVPADPASPPTTAGLRRWLRDILPGYMIPAAFTTITAIPLTANGKADRAALPAPGRPATGHPHTPPEGPAETRLAAIWATVLNLPQVGRHDNFFDLGGDSIRSIQILGAAKAAGLPFTIQQLFTSPTIAELAAAITPGTRPPAAPAAAPFSLLADHDRRRLPPGLDDAYPMASLQVGMLYEQERDPARRPYHNTASYLIHAPFSEPAFRQAIDHATARHPILRTSFDLSSYTQPLQLIHPATAIPLRAADIRHLTPDSQQHLITALMTRQRQLPFDPAQPGLLRVFLHQLTDSSFQLTLTEHHAIFDGWSLNSTITEILETYSTLLAGHRYQPPPPLRSAYRDFIALEQQAAASPSTARFWAARLAGRPAARLPRWPAGAAAPPGLTPQPRPGEYRHHATGDDHYGTIETTLPPDLNTALRDLARTLQTPLKTITLTAYLRVIAMITGSTDILTGLTLNGRPEEPDGDQARGLYLNTLPLRITLPDGTWQHLISTVFTAETELLPHRRYPLAELQAAHSPAAPLIETAFVYLHFHVLGQIGPETIGTTRIDGSYALRAEPASIPLQIAFIRSPLADHAILVIDYHTDKFPQAQITLIRDYILTALTAMTRHPHAPHHTADLISPAEHHLTRTWNTGTPQPPSPPGISHHITRHATATPHATAITSGSTTLTYRQLDTAASRLARHLLTAGITPRDIVAVCATRTPDTIITLLAILRTGAAYLPLDPAHPADRLAYLLADSRAAHVITFPGTAASVPPGPWQAIPVTSAATGFARYPATPPPAAISPADTAYVIYTSGSTGRPKGVAVTHASITATLAAVQDRFRFGPADTWTLFHSAGFDYSVWEMWGPLTTGGRLVVIPHWQSRTPEAFYRLVAAEHVTVLTQTPSAFTEFDRADTASPEPLALRWIILAGEPLQPPAIRRWTTRHGWGADEAAPGRHRGPRLANMYGITEATIHTTFICLDEGCLDQPLTVVGGPLGHASAQIVDGAGGLCPVGVVGEIYVGGPGVAGGYLHQPGLTADRFIADRFGPVPGARLYRSGDLGRWRPDGTIEYAGRADLMVKIRGFRIELGEIEAALAASPAVRDCIAAVRRDDTGRDVLAGYVVPADPASPPTTAGLRRWLRDILPGYMIPAAFTTITAIPLTANGKADRAALPAPGRPATGHPHTPPEGPAETRLAAIWATVLNLPQVGRHDNFFDLGGDSIRSIQILGAAKAAGLPFTIQQLFTSPTIAELAAAITPGTRPPAAPAAAPFSLLADHDRRRLPPGLDDAYPMASLQVGMLYEQERDPARRPYHNTASYLIHAPFSEPAFRQAIDHATARHPILRTSFDLSSYTQPLQLIHPATAIPLRAADIRHLTPDSQQHLITALMTRQRQLPFDPAQPGLLRVFLHQLTDSSFQLTLTEHHAIFDGWSLNSTITEILETYSTLLAGHRYQPPPPLRSAYRDFIALEQQAAASPSTARFWAARLAGRPAARLPRWPAGAAAPPGLTPQPRPGEYRHHATGDDHYGTIETTLPPDLNTALRDLARTLQTPLKTITLTAYLRVIAMITGSTDILTGLTLNGRPEEPDGDQARGLYLNTLPLRITLPDGTWQHLISTVFTAETELLPHRRYPLAELQAAHSPAAPLIETAFVYLHFHVLGQIGPETIGTTRIDGSYALRAEPASIPLQIAFIRSPLADHAILVIDYHTDKFPQAQITLIRDYILTALTAMTRHPHAPHHTADLISPAEHHLTRTWNTGTPQPPSPPGISHHITRHATATPHATAITSGSTTLTYRQLDTAASRLARHLLTAGITPRDIVAVCATRTPDTIITLLAILRTGAAYLPLDPAHPAGRLGEILADSGASHLIADYFPSSLPGGSWRKHDLREAIARSADLPATPPAISVVPEMTAYVTYTSGSTGRPKGVVISHKNIATLCAAEFPDVRGTDTVLHVSNLAFDATTFEIWATLVNGGRIAIPGPGSLSPQNVARWMADYDVTVAYLSASLFNLLVEEEPHVLGRLRLLLTGGEIASAAHVEAALRAAPRLTVGNCWGPTENTTFTASAAITAGHIADGAVPIGRPLPGNTVQVVGPACPRRSASRASSTSAAPASRMVT